MVDVSAVSDTAGGMTAGKADPAAVAQGGKAAASFFSVLAARMAAGGHASGAEPEVGLERPLRAAGDASADPALLAAMSGQPAAFAGQKPATSSAGLLSTPAESAAVPPATSPAMLAAPPPVSATAQPGAEDALPGSAPSSASGLPENPKARAEPPRYSTELPVKAANSAVEADARGQALPQALAAHAAAASTAGAAFAREGVVDALAAVSASSAAGQIAVAVPTAQAALTDPAMTRLFEVQTRQIDGRLNVAVEAPLRSPAFAGELAEKIVWLAGRHAQFAELSLNPPHLGSLEIRLSLSGGDAVAQFFSANASVRDALETAMPRLRELMAQAGINLGEAQVRDEAFARGEAAHAEPRVAAAPQAAEELAARAQPMRGMGLVDLYV